jgi:anti-anti-sigma regulatory factor
VNTKVGKYVLCHTPKPGVRVVRFLHPDNRDALDDGNEETCSLSQDIHATALADAADGETVVFNFALVEFFPTRFYSVLLVADKALKPRSAKIVVCNLGPNHRTGFDLMGGSKKFATAVSEERAVKEAA